MPTIMHHRGVRYFFYSNEGAEPPHVHIEYQGSTARFWLKPVELARNSGFQPDELRRVTRVITANAGYFTEVWHEFFGA